MSWIERLPEVIPYLAQYPTWVRFVIVAWLLATAATAGVLVVTPRSGRGGVSDELLPPTGDKVIDDVLAALAKLKGEGPVSEAKLVETMAPLFSRPAFYGIREENWQTFLYPLCRTRLILEENAKYFKSSATIRDQVGQAVQRMVKLQNNVARMYGPTFSVTAHIQKYVNSRDAFLSNLPPVAEDATPQFFDLRDQEINEIRAVLKPLGLTAW